MNEKYLLPSLGLLIVILLLGFGMIISNQSKQNIQITRSLDALALNLQSSFSQNSVPTNIIQPQTPSPSAAVSTQAQDAPITAEQLRARLTTINWTELYVATSPKGELALTQLNDIRSGQKKLSSTATFNLQTSGLQTAQFTSEGSITLDRCDEQLIATIIRDSEYSPGMRTIDLYTTASAFSKNTPQITYLATDYVTDAAGNRVPVLYGPYNATKADDLIGSFAALRCKTVSELK